MKDYFIHNWDAIFWAVLAGIFFILYMKQRLNRKAAEIPVDIMASKVYWLNFQFNIYFAVMAVLGIGFLKYLGIDVTIPESLYNFILWTTFFFSSVFVFSSLDSLVRYCMPYIRDILVAKITGAANIIPKPQTEEIKNGT